MEIRKTHTTDTQKSFRILLGSMLLTAGTGHLTFARRTFQVQVPNWVPLDKDLTVLLSGYAEIILALLILFLKGKSRTKIGLFAALFFVLVFPGNVAQYLNKRDGFGLDTDALRAMRLTFQPVLVLWALWSTGALDTLCQQFNSDPENKALRQ